MASRPVFVRAQAAPVWQREALHRVQWQVDVKRRKDARDAKTGRERANPLIPAWDKPAPPSKKHLLERELRQQRARVGVSEGDGDGVAAAASSAPISFSPRGAATMSSFGGPNMGGSYSGTYSGQPEDLVGENPARMVLGAADPNDTSQAHAVWLKHAAGQHDEGTTSRVNKIAFYEQALQQLTLQRQELDNSTESTKANIDGTQRSGEAPRIDTQLRNEHMRKERLKADLLTVQEKANAMTTSTQALMHVINSLRITRKRHVQRVHGLDVKEKTMDNDAQFLLGSASGAMEERERLRAKHERLKHEASAWRTMQLKEAAELGEKLTELDDETRELETRLHSLDEQATRLHFAGLRDATHSEQQRSLKYGYLRGQVAGWAAEFERVTAITGVRFGEGKSDAVDKVVSIYSANELRNKSLFKYVTEDIEGHKDSLQTELAAEEAAAIALEAEHVAHDAADAAASAKSLESSEAEAHLVHQLERASAGVEAILPLVEKLGLSCMDATSTLLPQHMAGQSLAPPTVPAFLALLEDALHKVLGRATTVVSARAPPVPQTEEEQKAFDLLPPEVVSDTLAILRGAVKARTLAKGKDDGKMMQNESSERLLSMS